MASYIKYHLKSLEPVRIADDSISQGGRTMTLRYIPGSTIRGIIVNALASDPDFESMKPTLFSRKVRFLNARPSSWENGHLLELLPSPKGFYEDRAETVLKNVVKDGTFDEGMKRARLGRFASFRGDSVFYYTVETDSDLKIVSNVAREADRNVFRNEYIVAGTDFTGYILAEDPDLREKMIRILNGSITAGNARSAGYGKCQVSSAECSETPYAALAADMPLENECYMFLLSNTVMRNERGELTGLDKAALEKRMGVSSLSVRFCASSVVQVIGHNRTWGGKIPSAPMYESGSVFHLSFKGTLLPEKMREIEKSGIGIRTNEGFGEVLFLKDYEKISQKQRMGALTKKALTEPALNGSEETILLPEDEETLRTIAAGYYRIQLEKAMQAYILDNPLEKGTESRSRLGILDALASTNKMDPKKACEVIEAYYAHALEKEDAFRVSKARASMRKIQVHALKVLKNSLEDTLKGYIQTKEEGYVMGIPKENLLTEEEEGRLRIRFLIMEIRFDNKGVE